MEVDRGKIENALLKKALGYTLEESVYEYSAENELIKRKVVEKYIPADLSAIKVILEADDAERKNRLEELSDEEIEELKEKYLKELETLRVIKMMSKSKNAGENNNGDN